MIEIKHLQLDEKANPIPYIQKGDCIIPIDIKTGKEVLSNKYRIFSKGKRIYAERIILEKAGFLINRSYTIHKTCGNANCLNIKHFNVKMIKDGLKGKSKKKIIEIYQNKDRLTKKEVMKKYDIGMHSINRLWRGEIYQDITSGLEHNHDNFIKKLPKEQVLEIIKDERKAYAIAKQYGIHVGTVSRIKNGHFYKKIYQEYFEGGKSENMNN